MTGLLLLVLMAMWLLIAFLFSRWIASWIKRWWLRFLVSAGAFAVLLLLPIADEIVGRFQFKEKCMASATLRVDPERVRGRTLRRVATQSRLAGGVLEIEQWDNRFIDVETGEELASYTWLRASGGILARAFVDSGKPITFDESTCAPPLREPIEKQYGFVLISK